jgi:dolichyl-diphosphooligosaccharide--protein glycosyltransferase
MELRSLFSKENVVNGFKKIGTLRIKVSHTSLLSFSVLAIILLIAFMMRIFPLRWEIQVGQLHLSEFDPYHQFRFTEYIVNNGFFSWASPPGWIDQQRWYPDGINVATTSYPGLALTAAFFFKIVTFLGVPIALMDFCAIFPAIMGMLAVLLIYFVGKDMGGKPVGLIAALFLALSPSYIQRTSVGFFDDETIGIVALLLFIFFFLRSLDTNRSPRTSMGYALASGLVLGYFSISWGASLFAVGAMMIFVLALILLKRYTSRLLLSFSLTFGISLLISISIPYLSVRYLMTFAVLPVAGVFALLCLFEIFRNQKSMKWKTITAIVFVALIIGGFIVLWQLGYMRTLAGKFLSVLNPLARADSPLVESVAEHRISSWGSIYYEFGMGIAFFLVGLFFVVKDLNNRNLFLLIFGLTSLYFAGSMVRLLVLLAPAFALLAAKGITSVLKPFNTLLTEPPKIAVKKKLGLEHVGKEYSAVAIGLIFIVLMVNFALPAPRVYSQANSPVTVTASSLAILPSEPVPQWLNMLTWTQSNLQSTTVVASWWDYGYWLTVLGNVTTLADNGTINSTQIENLGFIFMANETQSLKMLKLYDTEYILVFVTFYADGSWVDQGGGDNGKWTWMARISGKDIDRFISNGFVDRRSSWANETAFGNYSENQVWQWNNLGTNSTVYKLMSWGKQEWCTANAVTNPDSAVQPEFFDKAYFSGLELTADDATSKFGGLIPLVCLYKIDWQKYDSLYPDG